MNIFDIITTIFSLKMGNNEFNPLANSIGISEFLTLKFIIGIIISYIIYFIVKISTDEFKDNNKTNIANIMILIGAILFLFAGINNLLVMGGLI